MSEVHRAAPAVPRQLLPPPPGFTDRLAEIEFLDEQPNGVVVLRGQGGVGKTALALYWLNARIGDFPDGQLHADLTLSTTEPVPAEDTLGQFLRSLGVSPRDVPEGLAEREGLYRTLTAGKAIAVLLDDTLTAGQVRMLLPASSAALVVVTTRRPLVGLLASGARTLRVDPLDPAPALELLANRIGRRRVEAEPDAAQAIVEFCGGLPIALCVAAAKAAARPRRPLARMVDELADEQVRLDALSAEDDLSVRSMLDLAYSDLPDDLRLGYRALGLHPDGAVGVGPVSAMIEAEPVAAHRVLDALADASLVQELADDRYKLHDLVRVHARDRATALPERSPMVRRAMLWYLHTAQAANRIVLPARDVLAFQFARSYAVPQEIESVHGALGWLAENRTNLLTLARDAMNREWAEIAYHLADALRPLLILHKHRADSVAVAELELRAAQALGDSDAQLRAYKHLARVHINQGGFGYAEQTIGQLLHAARARGDRRAEAGALNSLGLLETRRGRLEAAADAFERAIVILRSLGRRRGEGLALISLGETLVRSGKARDARALLERAGELLGTLGAPDPYNEARARAALAHAHLECGDHALALPLLEDALTVFGEQGSDHERGRTHRLLAELWRRAGEEKNALRHDGLADTFLAYGRA